MYRFYESNDIGLHDLPDDDFMKPRK